ncbi:MAG: hypothetical protein ACK40U_05270, partial [Fervidobacterium pennivorans]
MSKFKYSDEEQKINSVLKYQRQELMNIQFPDMSELEKQILESEKLIKSLGYSLSDLPKVETPTEKKELIVP